jgi:hypothetical protein
MKLYLLSLFAVEGDAPLSDAELDQLGADANAVNASMVEQDVWVFGGGLHAPDTATVVRGREGDTIVTDGPFPEAKEQLAGFWVIRVPDLDAAIEWASRCSAACRGPVEVRPFDDASQDGMP